VFRLSPLTRSFGNATDDVIIVHMSEDSFPERKQHPQLAHAFVELPNEKKLLLGSFRNDDKTRFEYLHIVGAMSAEP
jgi:hypothetical protein